MGLLCVEFFLFIGKYGQQGLISDISEYIDLIPIIQYYLHHPLQPNRSGETQNAICSYFLSQISTSKELIRCNCVTFSFRDSFKGLSIVIPQVVLSNALFMQMYEHQRSAYLSYLDSTSATALSSITSRLVVSTIMNPIQALRVRKINSSHQNKIETSQGALKVTLVRDLIFSALYWSIIEMFRNKYSGEQYRGSQSDGRMDANAFAGILGGGIVAAITTPFDTVKTRLQSGIKLQGSIFSQIKHIYYKQGLTGLFSGVHFRAAKSGVHSASYLIFYQQIMSSLRKSQKPDF